VAEAGRLKPDLIVLDYSMPVMNRLEAAPSKVLPRTPIIILTMFANDVFATQAITAEVTAVVSKRTSCNPSASQSRIAGQIYTHIKKRICG
jgi:DNA-binding NarL/FixJ family response regulator